MRRARFAGVLGIGGCALFWAAMLVLGSLRPSYSHTTNAISELGARGTPNALAWNVFGFIVPGLLLAVTGSGIVASVQERTRPARIAAWLLPAFGLTIAGQGLIPAVMQNGELVTTSWSTRGHLVVSLIAGVAWLAALFLLMGPMKRSADWRGWHVLNVVAALLVILVGFVLGRRLPGGVAQRLVDAIVFVWFLAVSVRLIRLSAPRVAGSRIPPLSQTQ